MRSRVCPHITHAYMQHLSDAVFTSARTPWWVRSSTKSHMSSLRILLASLKRFIVECGRDLGKSHEISIGLNLAPVVLKDRRLATEEPSQCATRHSRCFCGLSARVYKGLLCCTTAPMTTDVPFKASGVHRPQIGTRSSSDSIARYRRNDIVPTGQLELKPARIMEFDAGTLWFAWQHMQVVHGVRSSRGKMWHSGDHCTQLPSMAST